MVTTRQSTLLLTLHWPLSVEQTQQMKAESRKSHLLPLTVCKTTEYINTPILYSLLCAAEPLLGWFCHARLHHHDITTIVELFVIYRTAGNFRGRKLSRIARFCRTKGCHDPNFTKKTFVYSHKTAKFAKVFSFESFPLYGTYMYRSLHRARTKLFCHTLTQTKRKGKIPCPGPSPIPKLALTVTTHPDHSATRHC